MTVIYLGHSQDHGSPGSVAKADVAVQGVMGWKVNRQEVEWGEGLDKMASPQSRH